jgi:hypothetical protein
MTGRDDGRQPRGAQPVHGDACDRLGQAGEERGHARDVAVVFASLICAAEVDVVDRPSAYPGTLYGRSDRDGGEIIRPDLRQSAGVAADRRSDGGDDHCARHAPRS